MNAIVCTRYGPPEVVQLKAVDKPIRKDNEVLVRIDVLKSLVEAGTPKPVIDQCFPMAQAAEAHRRVETGRKTGIVVIHVDHQNGHAA